MALAQVPDLALALVQVPDLALALALAVAAVVARRQSSAHRLSGSRCSSG